MNNSAHNYAPLFNKLEILGAQQALPTLWLLEGAPTARTIHAEMLALLSDQDRLLVVEVIAGLGWAATRLADSAGTWLKAQRP